VLPARSEHIHTKPIVNIVKPCTTCLTHLPSPLSDLRGETSLDSLDGTSRSAAVARDEVKAVLTLGETATR
jgi:hypothetical protein